ncbi:MAG: hypothetical protein FJ387_21770 [Verrucomicrobia bacterium]|nr:hypothetical protein [Verrucomicrobiota bacterium]
MLAALLFMAIVIPVAIQGLRIAGQAGVVAERKTAAARVAERILLESVLTTNWNVSAQTGALFEGSREYRWTLRNDEWGFDPNQSTFRLLTVEVEYPVQDRAYWVRLSTLVDSSQ